MAPPLNTMDLIVIQRDISGKSVSIYSSNGYIATQMAACVNMAREMIASEKGLSSLIKFGEDFEKVKTELKPWYYPREMKEVAQEYVRRMLDKWPPMVHDHTFTNPDIAGCTWRTKWEEDFDTSQHAIAINGQRFDYLCAAARHAKAFSNPNSKEHQRYRRFVVIHALTIVHELAHIFINFLGRGQRNTPESMADPSSDTSQASKGEAGAYLEYLMFGGRLLHLRNHAEGDEQSGELHLVNGEKQLRHISQGTVDKCCRYEFDLPFPSVPVNAPETKRSLGYGIPLDVMRNPLKQPDAIALLLAREQFGAKVNPFKWKQTEALMEKNKKPTTIQTDPKSAVYRLLFEPGLADEAVE